MKGIRSAKKNEPVFFLRDQRLVGSRANWRLTPIQFISNGRRWLPTAHRRLSPKCVNCSIFPLPGRYFLWSWFDCWRCAYPGCWKAGCIRPDGSHKRRPSLPRWSAAAAAAAAAKAPGPAPAGGKAAKAEGMWSGRPPVPGPNPWRA